MLCIIMQLDISARLTHQVTTIIYHHINKILLKKIQKYGVLDQNSMLTKTIHR